MADISFLNGGGDMGVRMRAHDWPSSSLGPAETWTQPLRTAVRLLLNTGHPMYIFWGPHGACLYNDAYRQSIGPERHPGSLGQPARAVWDEIWDIIGPQIEQVMAGRGATWHENHLVPITRNGRREDVYWTYSYGPIDDETAPNGVGGVLVVCSETTQAVLAQQRQAFRIKLDDALRGLGDARDIMAVAATMLGGHLRAGRCGYGEVDETGAFFTVERDWTDGIMPSLAGRLRLVDFGRRIVADLGAGRTVRLDDPQADVRTRASADAYASIGGMRAGIAVPLAKDGRFVAAFYVHQTSPRQWTDDEETLVREVAERTWSAVEQARAQVSLRRLNDTLELRVIERTARIQADESRIRAIFETSYQFQGLLTPDGILLEANAISLRSIGATLADVVGLPFWETPWFSGTPGMAGTVRDAVPIVAGGETVRQEIRVNLPVGGWRWFDFTMRPIHDSAGTVIAIVPEAAELTERRHAEEALRQAQKMESIGQLTGGIAHDFNNLLLGITGALDLIRNRIEAGRTDGLARFMDAASASAHSAAALTQRLLAFSRRQSLDTKPQRIAAIVHGMEDMLRRTLGKSIALEIFLPADLWPAMTDANQLESAILNLAINARDAMPNGGKLTIETSNTRLDEVYALANDDVEAGDYVTIAVSDTGSGMPPDVIAMAFEPFFTTKPIGQGTGLGLSMIYGFQKQSGGHVRICSELARGTTITLYLKRAPHVEEPATTSPKLKARHGRGEMVLVVEDDANVRLLMTEVLEGLGYRYIEASDARAALTTLESDQPIDLLVTDVGLPHINGRQLAEMARQHRPDLKVLFVTGYAENAAVRGGFLAAGMDLMTKPFTLDGLGAKIRELIER
jgi:hypothetical protein